MLDPGFSCASNSQNIRNAAELCNSPCHGYTQPAWRSPKLCLSQQLPFGIALPAQSSVPARLSLQIQALLPQPWQRQMLLHWHLQAWLSSRGCHSHNVSLQRRLQPHTLGIYLAYGSPGSLRHSSGPNRCSPRQKCSPQGILFKKYLNICSLLCCFVKRHQKANKRAWSLHNPLTPPHYKWSQNRLMNYSQVKCKQ